MSQTSMAQSTPPDRESTKPGKLRGAEPISPSRSTAQSTNSISNSPSLSITCALHNNTPIQGLSRIQGLINSIPATTLLDSCSFISIVNSKFILFLGDLSSYPRYFAEKRIFRRANDTNNKLNFLPNKIIKIYRSTQYYSTPN